MGVVFVTTFGPACMCLGSVIIRYRQYPDPWHFFTGMSRVFSVALVGANVSMFVAMFTPWSPDDPYAVGGDGAHLAAVIFFIIAFFALTMLPLLVALRNGEPAVGAHRRKRAGIHSAAPSTIADAPAQGLGSAPARATSSAANNARFGGVPVEVLGLHGVANLRAVLSDEQTRKQLRAHVAVEWGTESLAFLEAAGEWRAAFADVDARARLARARKIAKAYLTPGAALEVNIPGVMARSVRDGIHAAASNPADLTPEVFDECRSEVAAILEQGAVARMLANDARKPGAVAVVAP